MKNPENYRKINTCYYCPKKEPYITSENRVFYSCPELDDDDIEIDRYCGKHPKINNGDSFQETGCCANCEHILVSYINKEKYYECMFYAKRIDGGSEVQPDHICNFFSKDNGGVR